MGRSQLPDTTPPSVTGAFAGTDGGASTTFFATTSEDFGALGTLCASTNGIKQVHFGLATLHLQ